MYKTLISKINCTALEITLAQLHNVFVYGYHLTYLTYVQQLHRSERNSYL